MKSFALVFALSMPLVAFAASPGTGGAGAGAAGAGAAGTGGAPGTGTAGTGGGPGPGTGAGNSANPAAAAEPLQPTPPDKPTGIK